MTHAFTIFFVNCCTHAGLSTVPMHGVNSERTYRVRTAPLFLAHVTGLESIFVEQRPASHFTTWPPLLPAGLQSRLRSSSDRSIELIAQLHLWHCSFRQQDIRHELSDGRWLAETNLNSVCDVIELSIYDVTKHWIEVTRSFLLKSRSPLYLRKYIRRKVHKPGLNADMFMKFRLSHEMHFIHSLCSWSVTNTRNRICGTLD